MKTIAAVTIGQSPRGDVVGEMSGLVPVAASSGLPVILIRSLAARVAAELLYT